MVSRVSGPVFLPLRQLSSPLAVTSQHKTVDPVVSTFLCLLLSMSGDSWKGTWSAPLLELGMGALLSLAEEESSMVMGGPHGLQHPFLLLRCLPDDFAWEVPW